MIRSPVVSLLKLHECTTCMSVVYRGLARMPKCAWMLGNTVRPNVDCHDETAWSLISAAELLTNAMTELMFASSSLRHLSVLVKPICT